MDTITDIKEYEEKNLKEMVSPDTDLKNWLIEYTGEHKNLVEGAEVTLEMIIEIVAEEFPEFLLAMAEENWVRGYQQALSDIEYGEEKSFTET